MREERGRARREWTTKVRSVLNDDGEHSRGKRSGCPPLTAYSGGAFRVSVHFGGTDVCVRVRSGVYAATCWTREKSKISTGGLWRVTGRGRLK